MQWVADRAPGKPLICAIESARGVLAAPEIAAVPASGSWRWAGWTCRRDLNTAGGNLQTLYVRSHLVLASRAAGLEPPIDSVYPQLDDDAGLREQASFARSLGFFGKSAIHPRQLPVDARRLHPDRGRDRLGAARSSTAFERSGGAALRLPGGEFVDLPVADRAHRLLELAASLVEK